MKHDPKKRIILFSVFFLIIIILLVLSWKYRSPSGSSEDPRITGADKIYEKYMERSAAKDYAEAFALLDSLEKLYSQYSDYKNSYEMGTIYNNRAMSWLTLAFAESDTSEASRMLDSSKRSAKKAIDLYENWLSEFSDLSRNEIILKIKKYYSPSDSIFDNYNMVVLIDKRTELIRVAQAEIKTKLSHAYTNLATIYYKENDRTNAIVYNKKALVWWDKNPTAANNLKMLSGKSSQSF